MSLIDTISINSRIQLVRKLYAYKTPGVLAYHRGIVVEHNKDLKYIDVIVNNNNIKRTIRMFYNVDEQTFVYHDNDNNTKLYYHKTVSKKCKDKIYSNYGIQYELKKLMFDEIALILKHNNRTLTIYDTTNQSIQQLDICEKINRTINNLNGFSSNEFYTLSNLLSNNISLTLIKSCLQLFTIDELNELNCILLDKTNAIKVQNYEAAAIARDKELNFLKNIRY